MGLCRGDSWLAAAADCLELFPDQLIMVVGEQLIQQEKSMYNVEERLANQKRLLFDTIAKFYNSQEKQPLLSGRYLDIHIGILQLLGEINICSSLNAPKCSVKKKKSKLQCLGQLCQSLVCQYRFYMISVYVTFRCMQTFVFHVRWCVCLCVSDSGRREEALRASQLCMRMLSSSSRDELRRLLAFISAAANPAACRLQKQVHLAYLTSRDNDLSNMPQGRKMLLRGLFCFP